jgi:hypothetical protein
VDTLWLPAVVLLVQTVLLFVLTMCVLRLKDARRE